MTIPLPNLDDRSYAELTAQAQALLPGLCPEWTNHNPSDPGIVLIELLAWLTEMLLFQVNEIPPANTQKFLKLLNEPNDWERLKTLELDAAIRETIRTLRERYRAVTAVDYEYLALHEWPQSDAAGELHNAGKISRARCIPHRNLEAEDAAARSALAPAHVSLIVLPEPESISAEHRYPALSESLRAALWEFFDERRLLTTRHHVVGPVYVALRIEATVALRTDAPPAKAFDATRRTLAAFFDPITGGNDARGWPFGRTVYDSEVYAALEQIDLLDYVEEVQLSRLDSPTGHTASPEKTRFLLLDVYELVKLSMVSVIAYDNYGNRHEYEYPRS